MSPGISIILPHFTVRTHNYFIQVGALSTRLRRMPGEVGNISTTKIRHHKGCYTSY